MIFGRRITQIYFLVLILGLNATLFSLNSTTDAITHDEESRELSGILSAQNFCWLIDGCIAGMPQSINDFSNAATANALYQKNIGAIVLLNRDFRERNSWESEEAQAALHRYGIEHHTHLLDHSLKRTMRNLVTLLGRMAPQNKAIAIHCDHCSDQVWNILGCLLLVHHPDLAVTEPTIIAQTLSIVYQILRAHGKRPDSQFLQSLLSDQEFLEEMVQSRSPAVVSLVARQMAAHPIDGFSLAALGAMPPPINSPRLRPIRHIHPAGPRNANLTSVAGLGTSNDWEHQDTSGDEIEPTIDYATVHQISHRSPQGRNEIRRARIAASATLDHRPMILNPMPLPLNQIPVAIARPVTPVPLVDNAAMVTVVKSSHCCTMS